MPFFPVNPPAVTAAQISVPLDLTATGTSPVFGAGTTGDTFNRVELEASGRIAFGTGAGAVDTFITRSGAAQAQISSLKTGQLDISTVGNGLLVAEGANAKQGTFALSGAATTVVANSSVTATSRIFLTTQALGTVSVASTLAVSARSAGVSFTVTPSVSTDTSTVAFEIFEPG